MRNLITSMVLVAIVAGMSMPAAAVVVLHEPTHIAAWRGGYNTTWHPYLQNWPQAGADAGFAAFSHSAVQSAVDNTKAAYGGWDAKAWVTQVEWVDTAIPADLGPVVGSVEIDPSTLSWFSATAYTAGGGNWRYNGTNYASFSAAALAGHASGDSMVVTGADWQAIWKPTGVDPIPAADYWNIEVDVPESLITQFLRNPETIGFFIGATKSDGYISVFGYDQWGGPADLRIEITQPPQDGPWIAVSNNAIDEVMELTNPVSAPQSITVTNAGIGSLAWTAAETPDVAWITLQNASGAAGDAFDVVLDVSTLSPGNYTAKIQVADAGANNSPVDVWVDVAVFTSSTPTIELDPTPITVQSTTTAGNPSPIAVTVNNIAFGALSWTAQEQGTVAWLSLSDTTGSDGDQFLILIDKSGLAAGTYNANAEVTDPTASNSPVVLPITLEIRDQDADIDKANGYDDAWEDGPDGWVVAGRTRYNAKIGGSDGFVVQLGDSITYANPYGQWARYGSGKTAADNAICTWMNVSHWPTGSNVTTNGWYLAAYDMPGGRSYTAESGIRADQYIVGSADLPSIDEMFTVGFTNPDGKQYRDALIAIVMLGTNDASSNRATSAYIADMATLVDRLEASNIIVCLSTLPPKRNDMTDVQNYNAAVRNLAQTRKLPMIDFGEEVLRRRPGTTWDGTLISGDGVHPSSTADGLTASSDPYANNGAALSEVGYLLRDWLSVQKVQEIKAKVIDPPPPPALVSSDPFLNSTLCRMANNCVTLTFDSTVAASGTPSIVPTAGSAELSASFTVTFDGATVTMQENGAVLANQTWYTVSEGTLSVMPFSTDACTLIGDTSGDGIVMALDLGAAWDHNGEVGNCLRADTNGDGIVMALDLGAAWAHNGEMVPLKP